MHGGETPRPPVINPLLATLPAHAPYAPIATLAPPAPPLEPYSPQSISFPQSIPKATLMPYLQYITHLSEIQQYTVTQYTHHGDIMVNALLRGLDAIDTYKDNIATPDFLESIADRFEPSCLFLYLLAPDLARNGYFKTTQPKLHRVTYYLLDQGLQQNGHILNHWDESVKASNFRRSVLTTEFSAHKRAVFEQYRNSIYPELKMHLDAGDLNYFREKTYEAFKIIFEAIQGIAPYIPYDPMDAPKVYYRGVRSFYMPRDHRPFAMNSFLSTSVEKNIANEFADLATGGLYEFYCFSDVPSLYLPSLSRFPREFEMVFCPGIKLQYIKSSTNEYGFKVDTYAILKPDGGSIVGTTVPETYNDYMRWESSLEVGRTPVRPGQPLVFLGLPVDNEPLESPLAVPVPIGPIAAPFPPLPASPIATAPPAYSYEGDPNVNLYLGGARRHRTRRGGGVNPKQKNKTRMNKKLNVAASKQQGKPIMAEKPVSIPGDRWDSKLPIKYQVLELTKEDEKTLERIKEFIARNEKK